ncbi:MAG: hypothetical protein L6Q74_04510 [Sphaerotilus natans subsp. sulfidivorans]|uniref:hypothetical protein n=1 Tax=Sphaerotilus sulfidivorans TaxID=639200 RepID=UPI00235470E3|nr:hypothetical protein [Sphaerotilus sulfidivorans]MCK6401166.1 hypothetical protein [Sphaerotilus sulfidivorans]
MNAQQYTTFPADPFALMMNPQDILAAVERSERLGRLQRRVCRPLDRPLIPHALTEIELFDRSIDAGMVPDEELPEDEC